jgi:hypothetical protein
MLGFTTKMTRQYKPPSTVSSRYLKTKVLDFGSHQDINEAWRQMINCDWLKNIVNKKSEIEAIYLKYQYPRDLQIVQHPVLTPLVFYIQSIVCLKISTHAILCLQAAFSVITTVFRPDLVLTRTDSFGVTDVGSPPDPLPVSQDSPKVQEVQHCLVIGEEEDDCGGRQYLRHSGRAQALGGDGQ